MLQKGSNAGSRVCHMIGRFRSILFVFFFHGLLAIVIMTDGTKNAIMVSFGLNARIRMLLKKRNKGPVIRATFLFSLSRNSVAVQVENLCCAYYHVCDQLVWQQNTVLQVCGILHV